MVRETRVQSLVMSYQRLLKWYLISPCFTLSNIRYVSRIKWSNPGKGVVPSPTPRCSSYWKGSLLVVLDKREKTLLTFTYLWLILRLYYNKSKIFVFGYTFSSIIFKRLCRSRKKYQNILFLFYFSKFLLFKAW